MHYGFCPSFPSVAHAACFLRALIVLVLAGDTNLVCGQGTIRRVGLAAVSAHRRYRGKPPWRSLDSSRLTRQAPARCSLEQSRWRPGQRHMRTGERPRPARPRPAARGTPTQAWPPIARACLLWPAKARAGRQAVRRLPASAVMVTNSTQSPTTLTLVLSSSTTSSAGIQLNLVSHQAVGGLSAIANAR